MTTPNETSSPSLATLQQQVDAWIHKVGKGYYGVLTNTALLMEEVGELARLLARHYGEQSFKAGEDPSPEAIAEEMADVLFVLICLANQTGTDLARAFAQKLEKKTQRDRARHAKRAHPTPNLPDNLFSHELSPRQPSSPRPNSHSGTSTTRRLPPKGPSAIDND